MRVLILGGAGYIGSVLTRQLLADGHTVRIVDTFQYSSPPSGAQSATFEAIRGDVLDFDDRWLDKVDAVAHLAGFSNDPTADAFPEENERANFDGTVAVAAACERAGIARFTFASSASIYDGGDEYGTPVVQRERSAVRPVGHYSRSKYNAERALLTRFNHIHPIILRQGTVYGLAPRMRFDLMVNQMTRDGVCRGKIEVHGFDDLWRPLLSVENCARVHLSALTSSWNIGPRIVNVVDQNATVRQVAERVARQLRLIGTECVVETVKMPAGRRVRNYRVEPMEWRDALGPAPMDELEECVVEMGRWLEDRQRVDGFNAYDARFENLAMMIRVVA